MLLTTDWRCLQLNRILTLVGSPSDQDLEWIPKETTRDYVRKLQSRPRENFQKVFGGASPEAIDLLDQIFQVRGGWACSEVARSPAQLYALCGSSIRGGAPRQRSCWSTLTLPSLATGTQPQR